MAGSCGWWSLDFIAFIRSVARHQVLPDESVLRGHAFTWLWRERGGDQAIKSLFKDLSGGLTTSPKPHSEDHTWAFVRLEIQTIARRNGLSPMWNGVPQWLSSVGTCHFREWLSLGDSKTVFSSCLFRYVGDLIPENLTLCPYDNTLHSLCFLAPLSKLRCSSGPQRLKATASQTFVIGILWISTSQIWRLPRLQI